MARAWRRLGFAKRVLCEGRAHYAGGVRAFRITVQLVAVAKFQDYFSKHKTVFKFYQIIQVQNNIAIATSCCYHSFFLLFTNFNIYFCNLIRFIQILIAIFVKEIRK